MGTTASSQLKFIQTAVKLNYSDAAIRRASNGRFHSFKDAANAMTEEFLRYAMQYTGVSKANELPHDVGNGYAQLKKICGIDLQNDDTGAITGVDAGNAMKKTAANVVADASPKTLTWPNGKTAIRGVVFHAPAQGRLSKAQQDIVKDICNRWANGALAAIEQSLGVTFSSQVKSKDITISFATPKNKPEGWNNRLFTSAYVDGKMVLYVNMANRTIKEHTNGTVYNSAAKKYEEYADVTLAHELTRLMTDGYKAHGFSYTSIRSLGLSELVTGADAQLKNTLLLFGKEMHIDGTSNLFKLWDDCQQGYRSETEIAAYGYMIWRYMAKYVAEHPSGPELYSTDGKKVTLTSSFKGSYDLDDVDTVRVVDASKTTADITLLDTRGSNNTYYLGKGKTTIKTYGGKDTYYGFKSGKDVIMFQSGTDIEKGVKYNWDVKDLILTYGGNEIRVKDVVGKKILMMRTDNKTRQWWPPILKKVAPPLGTGYKTNSKETVMLATSSTFSGTVDGRLYTQVNSIDMRGSKKATTIYGNGKANTIYASAGGSKMYGLGGNDTLVGGAGKDTFYFGTADGTDIVKNYNGKQDVIRLTSGKYTAAQFKSHVALNKANGEVDITNGKTKVRVMSGLGQKFTVYGADGKLIYNNVVLDNNPSLNKKTSTVTLNKNYIGTMDLRKKPYTAMSNVNAASATHKVTLYGNGRNNTMTAGNGGSELHGLGGNNTLIGGNGRDVFYVGKGEGRTTVIQNFGFNSGGKNPSTGDVLQLTAGTGLYEKADKSGRDLILKFTDGSQAKIINGVGQFINIRWADGSSRNDYYFWNNPARTHYENYRNDAPTTLVAERAFSGTLDTQLYLHSLTTVDARRAVTGTAVNMLGSSNRNQVFYASPKGGYIRTMSGNDTIYCNNGADAIYFGLYDGQDTVYGSRKNDIAYLFDVKDVRQVHGKFSKGVMKLTIDGRKDALSFANWNANSSLNQVKLGNNQMYRLKADGRLTRI